MGRDERRRTATVRVGGLDRVSGSTTWIDGLGRRSGLTVRVDGVATTSGDEEDDPGMKPGTNPREEPLGRTPEMNPGMSPSGWAWRGTRDEWPRRDDDTGLSGPRPESCVTPGHSPGLSSQGFIPGLHRRTSSEDAARAHSGAVPRIRCRSRLSPDGPRQRMGPEKDPDMNGWDYEWMGADAAIVTWVW